MGLFGICEEILESSKETFPPGVYQEKYKKIFSLLLLLLILISLFTMHKIRHIFTET
jgi:hypothetical protein